MSVCRSVYLSIYLPTSVGLSAGHIIGEEKSVSRKMISCNSILICFILLLSLPHHSGRTQVQVVYCIYALAEICHVKKLAPFFTGRKSERKAKKAEWKQKARTALRKGLGFEGWQVKDSKLLAQVSGSLCILISEKIIHK